ncbi:MAG: family 43 glycosylhydrolase [Tenericutes bacterium]|nr:family 43 glycosylhydrolase [Mycoplasmatota bacterium]
MNKYKNPIELNNDSKRVNVGDPFVFKYDGEYYLYVSTEANEIGIRCFKSKDLVNWEYQLLVTEDPITLNAYAPEVIFFKDKFYLVTSPGGNGHYIFTAKHPLGPFKRVTDNLGNMIDGSFYKEYDRLYLSRANHFGITIHEVTEDFKLINRVDLDAEMHGWTEGSFIIKRRNNYFMTYCGNNLFADTYRVDYSSSKELLGPYIKGINNSLINKLNNTYKALGHSAMIKGPDLDTYYNVYHKLTEIDDYSIRDYCVDRLDFQGSLMKQNVRDTYQDYPRRPIFESNASNHSENFVSNEDIYLTKETTELNYVTEFNFKGTEVSLIFAYSKDYYYELKNHNEGYGIFKISNLETKLILDIDINLARDCINKFELRQTEKLEVFINDDLKLCLDIQTKGKLGFNRSVLDGLSYIAYNNYIYRNVNGIQTVPNLVFSEDLKEERVMKKGDILNFSITGTGEFLSTAFIKVLEPITLKIGDSIVTLESSISPYEYNKEILGEVVLDGDYLYHIEVLSGHASFKYLEFEQIASNQTKVIVKDDLLKETYNIYPIEEYCNSFKTTFEIKERALFSRFGLLVNVSTFSDFVHQARYPFDGYFVGFYKDLLVVDKVNFGIKRIYDIPFKLDSQNCNLEVRIDRNKILVFINHKKIFECFDQYIKNTGQIGTYSCELSKVIFRDTLGGILDE